MKKMTILLVFLALMLAAAGSVHATDIRISSQEAEIRKKALLEQSLLEKAQAEKEAAEQRERIFNDKSALTKAIASLEGANHALKERVFQLKERKKDLASRKELLLQQVETDKTELMELQGFVGAAARDLDTLLTQSPQNIHRDKSPELLRDIQGDKEFPGLGQLQAMMSRYFHEMQHSGEVSVHNNTFVDRKGKDAFGTVLMLGNFTATYRTDDETGFLVHSTASNRMFALSRLPGAHYTKAINNYLDGKSPDVPIDISKGAALRQYAQQPDLWSRIPQGGPLVWPILALAIAALLIVVERLVFLLRVRTNADKLMKNVVWLAKDKKWEKCVELCKKQARRPVPRVLLSGLRNRDESREDMENALHESILGQVPRLERFLSTLAMMAAIAPLLGLLGTVTGMINTFSVMTVHGAGDPRMMSGGISEALVTTMLGLGVAIPIMLSHTLLSRSVDNIIAQMEEKSVALVNTICAGRKNP